MTKNADQHSDFIYSCYVDAFFHQDTSCHGDSLSHIIPVLLPLTFCQLLVSDCERQSQQRALSQLTVVARVHGRPQEEIRYNFVLFCSV